MCNILFISPQATLISSESTTEHILRRTRERERSSLIFLFLSFSMSLSSPHRHSPLKTFVEEPPAGIEASQSPEDKQIALNLFIAASLSFYGCLVMDLCVTFCYYTFTLYLPRAVHSSFSFYLISIAGVFFFFPSVCHTPCFFFYQFFKLLFVFCFHTVHLCFYLDFYVYVFMPLFFSYVSVMFFITIFLSS